MKKFRIAPSILSADFARLGEDAQAVIDAGADMIHFDVMDNHYVPNLSVGPMVCQALRSYGITAPIDVHLMVRPVDSLIEGFIAAGASSICFHPEACDHVDRSLARIRNAGVEAGLALNPASAPELLDYVMERLDNVLLMSVNPGFGGPGFHSCHTEQGAPRQNADRRERAGYQSGRRWRRHPEQHGRSGPCRC